MSVSESVNLYLPGACFHIAIRAAICPSWSGIQAYFASLIVQSIFYFALIVVIPYEWIPFPSHVLTHPLPEHVYFTLMYSVKDTISHDATRWSWSMIMHSRCLPSTMLSACEALITRLARKAHLILLLELNLGDSFNHAAGISHALPHTLVLYKCSFNFWGCALIHAAA